MIQEITQSRAIDVQALVGHIGGYIGLCLGYSFLQIPNFVRKIIHQMKKLYWNRKYRKEACAQTESVLVAEQSHILGDTIHNTKDETYPNEWILKRFQEIETKLDNLTP